MLGAALLLGLAACARRMPPPGKPETRGPEIRVLVPQEGDTVRDTLRVQVEATDSSGVAWVRVFLDQNPVGADSSAPYEFLWPLAQTVDTVHTLRVEAADRWDNTSRQRLWVVTRGGLAPPRQDSLPPDTLNPDTLKEDDTHAPHKKN